MGKTVLILGNGFDLAHGLPTKYSDFLDFCDIVLSNELNDIQDNFNMWLFRRGHSIKTAKTFRDTLTFLKNSMEKFLCKNVWYRYLKDLYRNNTMKGENWIDFELEISSIIQLIDKTNENLLYEFNVPNYNYEDVLFQNNKVMLFLSKYVKPIYWQPDCENTNEVMTIKIKELRKILYSNLETLTQALKCYLLYFIEKLPINKKSVDINKYSYIINFNYTYTYQRVYNRQTTTVHIHGEVSKEPNNMVLGIDEYWSEEERDSHTNFTIFKKFAQRIQKKIGIEIYKFFEEIDKAYKNNRTVSEVHIFGHSLDITDKDILYNFLESEATDVTIYCKDEETEGEYIANVIKIIGEKRLLEKVNQYPPKLKFVIQQPMVQIEKKKKVLSTLGAAT